MEVTQRGGSLSKEAASIAHAEAGGSPHWLKLLAERTGGAGGRVDAAALSRAVDELLSPRMRGLFADEGHEHLLRRYGPDTSRTLASILNACAGDDGAPFEALVTAALAVDPQLRRRGAEELIYRLADEYYLTPATPPDPWRFTLPLLRKWWLRYGGAR
jgi:hypothetical protein